MVPEIPATATTNRDEAKGGLTPDFLARSL